MEFVRRMRPPPGSADRIPRRHAASPDADERPRDGRHHRHRPKQFAGRIDAPFMNDEDRVDALFLATLARRPESDESKACLATLATCKDSPERDRTLSDILWALLNSTEFAFNQ